MEAGLERPAEEEGTTAMWLRKHRLMYTAATRHPFILSIRDGSVDLNSFKRWLGQDYLFVRAFVPFVSSVLLKACWESDDNSDMEVLLSSLAALNDEIAWFKKEASKWGVVLASIAPQRVNKDYCRFLKSSMEPGIEYTVAIAALWAIELVYQQSFAYCLEEGSRTPPELAETCQRWGNEGFGQYCQSLQKIADRQLPRATNEERKKAEAVLLRVLEHEVEFWNMSHG
ncbi:probable bifunctional TENA-E protein [Rhodamnia argentea]|uniref:aminopyrimidine aminohydrolase n=1 Tax=Rhodamnia argentea TaxID=178133 RepID=A0A8B8NZB8_9MYRT|nr:probable bifunctional TENA-E protein [Rhodamnia argentea]